MADLIRFVGRSGCGKTTLLEAVAAELARASVRVGYLKHAPHGADFDRPGSDTARLAAAGARVSAAHAGTTLCAVSSASPDASPAALAARHFPGCDLVLVEGYKSLPGEKLEVVRQACSDEPLLGPADGVVAYVADVAGLPAPTLPLDDPEGVAAFVRDRVRRRGQAAVVAGPDGERLELHDFVARALAGTLRALLDELREVDPAAPASLVVTDGARPSAEVRSAGRRVPLKPFVAELVGGTARGMLATLKDVPPGPVTIDLAAPVRGC